MRLGETLQLTFTSNNVAELKFTLEYGVCLPVQNADMLHLFVTDATELDRVTEACRRTMYYSILTMYPTL